MVASFVDPYTGKTEETCSVSFVAQQEMGAHSTGSPQTEAQFNRSKLLGEWGVIKAKLAAGDIPNGTKVLAFTGEDGRRGYLYVRGGKLAQRIYDANGKLTLDSEVGAVVGEVLVKSKSLSVSIPKSAAGKADDATPVDWGKLFAERGSYTDGQVLAQNLSGQGRIVWDGPTRSFQVETKQEGLGWVPADKPYKNLTTITKKYNAQGWVVPSPAAPPQVLEGQAVHDMVKKGLYKRGSLDPKQRKALQTYETGWSLVINNWLRTDRPIDPLTAQIDAQTGRTVDQLDSAMKDSVLTSDIRVYRGTFRSDLVFGDSLSGNLEGFTWHEKGYGSTTTNIEVTKQFNAPGNEGNVLMTVKVSKGIKALEVSTWDKGSDTNGPQAEIMLQHDLQWRVVKDNGYDGNGVRQLEVEVYPLDGGQNRTREDAGADGGGTEPSSEPTAQPAKASPEPAVAKKIATPIPATPVDAASPSKGSMSHEDVAAMFVKIKDDLAKEQGLNIKGANPQLDQLVYTKIGEATGYTALEVKGKIDAYRADGNKLSVLKRRVMSGARTVPDGKPLRTKASPAAPLTAGTRKPATDPKPNEVPTVATPRLADAVKAEVKAEVASDPIRHYSHDDVAAAYVIAKDKIVAESDGRWTLYSRDPELEAKIAAEVALKTGGLTPEQQKRSIASFLASGKKLSSLKKQLIRQGALDPKADTLRGSND